MGPATLMADPIAASQHPSSAACQSLRSVELPTCNLLTYKEIQRTLCDCQPKIAGVWRLCNGLKKFL